MKNNLNKHIISIQIENKFGALARVSSLFSGRGYNIESLTVNETEKNGISNMTIVTYGEEEIIEQIIKQLRKLINVIKVREVSLYQDHIERELALVKLSVNSKSRSEIMAIIEPFRARVINMTHDATIVEVSGSADKVNSFIELVRPYGLIEVLKTGVLAMSKGELSTTETKN